MNTSCSNNEVIFQPIYMILYQTVVSIILLTGVTLNGLVVCVYCSHRIKKTLFNYCLMHLSCANIGQLFGAVPGLIIDMKYLKSKNEMLGRFLCGLAHGNSLFFSFCIVTIGTLCLMSITRYIAIASPLKMIRKKKVKFLLFLLWPFGLMWMIPNYIRMHAVPNQSFCDVKKEMKLFSKIFLGLSFLLNIIIPITMATTIFTMTTYHFYRPNTTNINNTAKKRHRKQVLILLGSLIAVYIFCWIPQAIFLVVATRMGDSIQAEYIKARVGRLTIVPCFLSSSFNVVMYGLRSAEFKVVIRSIKNHTTNSIGYALSCRKANPKRVRAT